MEKWIESVAMYRPVRLYIYKHDLGKCNASVLFCDFSINS